VLRVGVPGDDGMIVGLAMMWARPGRSAGVRECERAGGVSTRRTRALRCSARHLLLRDGEAALAGDLVVLAALPALTGMGIARLAFGADSGVSRQAQERLARLGYLRVDASGLFAGHRYVEADQIASVSEDRVHLSVPADQLYR